MQRFALAFAIFLLYSISAPADDGHHHEDLTTEQLGTVHFPVSCATAVQKPFERGVRCSIRFGTKRRKKNFKT